MKIGSLFSGYGGLDMAVEAITGATPAWFCEWDEAPSKILNHHWPHVPNLRDVTQVDWSQVEPVDIITGGSPCQDLSAAGKRAGMTEGTRSNLWVNMREAIAVIKPRLVVWENVLGALSATATSDSDMEPSAGLLGNPTTGHLRALGRVLGDLTDLGYDTRWTTLRASDIGAPHHRARVFLIAWPQEISHPEGRGRDHGQAPDDGQTNREVNAPRNDCDDPADPERNNGGAGSSGGDRREAPIRTFTTGGPEHSCGAGDENFTDTSNIGPQTGHIGTCGYGGMKNGNPAESGPAEVLRDMRGGVLPQEVQRPIRGQNPIPEPKDMRTVMREQQEGSSGRFPQVEGATDSQANGMCDMPLDPESACAPQGQEPGEQFAAEPGDPLQELSSETPLEGGPRVQSIHNQECDWGPYTAAIRRWERTLGRPAPNPTEPNTKGKPRLSAVFAEYLMGLPAGHVTAPEIGLTRAQQLKAIGNGVCPQQAEAALLELLQR